MTDKRQLIPIAGLIATIAIAMYMVAQLDAQAPTLTGNFSNVIDSQEVGTAVADRRGHAELEVESITSSPGQP